MHLAFLPILPCIVLAPFALVALVVVLPLWIAALVVVGVLRPIVWLLVLLVRPASGGRLRRLDARLARALYWLTHPRFRRRERGANP